MSWGTQACRGRWAQRRGLRLAEREGLPPPRSLGSRDCPALRSAPVGAVYLRALHPATPPGSLSSPRALWSGASGPRRHGARASRRCWALGAGASRARRVRRGPGGLGLLAGGGGRAAGGRERGEDGCPHPEAVLPGPGAAAHQLHPAGPGEVTHAAGAPGLAPRPAPSSSALRPGPPATPSPAAALARAPSPGGGGPTARAQSLERGLHSRPHSSDGQLGPGTAGPGPGPWTRRGKPAGREAGLRLHGVGRRDSSSTCGRCGPMRRSWAGSGLVPACPSYGLAHAPLPILRLSPCGACVLVPALPHAHGFLGLCSFILPMCSPAPTEQFI